MSSLGEWPINEGDTKLDDGSKPRTIQYALYANLAFLSQNANFATNTNFSSLWLNVTFALQVTDTSFAYLKLNVTFEFQVQDTSFASMRLNTIFAFQVLDMTFMSLRPNTIFVYQVPDATLVSPRQNVTVAFSTANSNVALNSTHVFQLQKLTFASIS